MKEKTYPEDILTQISTIGAALKSLFDRQTQNLRTLSRASDMSVNSVKAVLAGATGNIASYALVAKALDTDLITLISQINTNHYTPLAVSKEEPTPEVEEEEEDPTNSLLIQ